MGASRKKPDLATLSWFSIGQVAKLCGVSVSLVRLWAVKGSLRHVRLPGGCRGDRRFARSDVVAFMRGCGFRIPRSLTCGVLLATPDTRLAESLRHLLIEMRVDVASSLFEMGCAIGAAQSDGVAHQLAIIDAASLGRRDAITVATYLPGVHLIGITTEDDCAFGDFTQAGYHDMFQSPVDPDVLAHRIREITSAKDG